MTAIRYKRIKKQSRGGNKPQLYFDLVTLFLLLFEEVDDV